MTLEELREKYPVGSKIVIVQNSPDSPVWNERDMSYLLGTTQVVTGHKLSSINSYVLIANTNLSEWHTPNEWYILPEWIVDCELHDEDPDALLKKQRDDLLASIFGG